MSDLNFSKDPEEMEKEHRPLLKRLYDQRRIVGWQTGLKVCRWPTWQFPTEDCSAQLPSEACSAGPIAHATE